MRSVFTKTEIFFPDISFCSTYIQRVQDKKEDFGVYPSMIGKYNHFRQIVRCHPLKMASVSPGKAFLNYGLVKNSYTPASRACCLFSQALRSGYSN